MKKHRLSVLSALVLAALSSSAVAEEVVYSQLPNETAPNTLNYFDGFVAADAVSGQPNDQATADDFFLDSDVYLTGVKWWGASDKKDSTDLDNFASITVKIFTKMEWALDERNVLYQETFRMYETNHEYISGGSGAGEGVLPYKHRVTFKIPVELCKGDQYWISIGATNVALPPYQGNITTSKNSYMWFDAKDPVGGNSIWVFDFSDIMNFSDVGVSWSELPGDQAFVLYGDKTDFFRATHCPDRSGMTPTETPDPTVFTPTPTATPTPVAEVPIPAAVWLFGSGLAGLFAAARKKRKAAS